MTAQDLCLHDSQVQPYQLRQSVKPGPWFIKTKAERNFTITFCPVIFSDPLTFTSSLNLAKPLTYKFYITIT